MDEKLESLKRTLRITYADIVRGYCYSKKFDCFIKHFNDEDLALIGEHENICRVEAREKGLATEGERITELINHGSWTALEEGEMNSLLDTIKNTMMHEARTFGGEKKENEEKRKELEKKFEKLDIKRKDILGFTVEKFMSRKRSDYSIFCAFYQDRALTKPTWSHKDFEELDYEEMYEYVGEYNDIFEQFEHTNIKRIACQPYFLNKFFIANGDPMVFFGKCAVALTQFQSEIMSQGRMYKNILENNEKGDSPPESWYDDPDKLVKWYYAQMKLDSGIRESASSKSAKGDGWKGASSVPGADLDEMQAMASSSGDNVVDLNDLIEKKKTESGKEELSLYDMLQIHGEDTSLIDEKSHEAND